MTTFPCPVCGRTMDDPRDADEMDRARQIMLNRLHPDVHHAMTVLFLAAQDAGMNPDLDIILAVLAQGIPPETTDDPIGGHR
jgi:hypothetical protein